MLEYRHSSFKHKDLVEEHYFPMKAFLMFKEFRIIVLRVWDLHLTSVIKDLFLGQQLRYFLKRSVKITCRNNVNMLV